MNNPLYSDPELEHQFKDSDSKVLITLDALGNRMIDLRPKTKIKQIVYMGIGDFLNPIKRFLGKKLKKFPFADVKAAPDVYRWMDCICQVPAQSAESKTHLRRYCHVSVYRRNNWRIQGGYSDPWKSQQANPANRRLVPDLWKGNEIMLGALPYFHVFGLSCSMNLSVYDGWNQILIPRPQPEPLLEAIRTYRPTFTPLVPTMYIGMLNHPDLKKTDMSCIKGSFFRKRASSRRSHS